MASRETISIYSNGRIQDWLYFRNWSLEALLLECIEIVERLGDSTEYGVIRARLGKDPDAWYDEEGLLDAVGFSDFDAVIDLTDRVVFHRHHDESLGEARARSSMSLLTTPEEYREAERVSGWPEGALMSFDVLGHVWIENSDLLFDSQAAVGGGPAYRMDDLPPIARQAYRDRHDFYGWDGMEADWSIAAYPSTARDAPLHGTTDAGAGNPHLPDYMELEAVRRTGLHHLDGPRQKSARHLRRGAQPSSDGAGPMRATSLPYDPDVPYRIEVTLASDNRAKLGCTACHTLRTLAFGELEQAVEEYRLLADLERVKALLDINERSGRYANNLRTFLEEYSWTTPSLRSPSVNAPWHGMEGKLLTVALIDGDERLTSRTFDFASYTEACVIVSSLRELGYIDQQVDFSDSKWRLVDGSKARTPQSTYHAVRVRSTGGEGGLTSQQSDRTLWLLEVTVESASEAPCGIAPAPDEYERNIALNNVCHFEQEATMAALRFMSDLIHRREFPQGIPSLTELMEAAHLSTGELGAACHASQSLVEEWLAGEERPDGYAIAAIAHELGVTELDVRRAIWLS